MDNNKHQERNENLNSLRLSDEIREGKYGKRLEDPFLFNNTDKITLLDPEHRPLNDSNMVTRQTIADNSPTVKCLISFFSIRFTLEK